MSEPTAEHPRVAVLGIFVADLTFRAARLPRLGETVLGDNFALGPGGKGGNQAVAAARTGAATAFISRVGDDAFADIALQLWSQAGVDARVERLADEATGAAFIYVDNASGDNAIIVSPGAANRVSAAYVDTQAAVIAGAEVFVTQLEQPIDAARRGLQIARNSGTVTVLNPAPAAPLDDDIYPLCDYLTPNESEAEALTGLPVNDLDQARRAGDALLAKGVGAALITLGERGALLHSNEHSTPIPAFNAGPVVETTGAGDAFNGAFAAALSRGSLPIDAVRFGCAAAGLSVTRAGAAASMPELAEVEALLATNQP